MEKTNIYKKVGRKYEPIGLLPGSFLTEGIWLVRKTPHSTCITNGDYARTKYVLDKLCDGTTPELSFQEVLSLEKKKDELLKEFNNTFKDYTLDELFSWILGKLIKKD